MSGLEDCGNCGRRIGKLERANVWNEHVVCEECWRTLTRCGGQQQTAVHEMRSAPPLAAAAPPPLPERAPAGGIRPVSPAWAMVRSAAPPTGEPEYDVSSAPAVASTIAAGYLLKCAQCGGSYRLSEVSEVGGRIVCRECTLAEAAHGSRMRGWRGAARNPWLLTVGGSAVALALFVGGAVYLYDRVNGKPQPDKLARADTRKDARDNDDGMGGRLVDLMLDGAKFEAAGNTNQARAQYQMVVTLVGMRRDASPAQQKLAARAQEAIGRLQRPGAGGATPPRNPSIFDDVDSTSGATANAASDATPPPQRARAAPGSTASAPARPPTMSASAAPAPTGDAAARSPTERGKTQRVERPEPPVDSSDEEPTPTTPSASARAGTPTPPNGNRPRSTRRPSAHGPEIDRGRDALAAGQYPAALELFKAAMSIDKKSPHAHHGFGLAYYGLGQKSKAIEALEKGESLGTNRAIVHNLAVVHMKDNPMRAAKFVREFLALPTTPLDEPLQNVLGKAMVSANGDARAGAVYAALRKFYLEYDHRLAVARNDGTKRWGMRWIGAEDADVRWANSKKAADDLAKASRDAGRASVRTKKAYQAGRDIATSFRLHSEREKRAAVARYRGAMKDEEEARKRLATARSVANSTEQPQFPSHLDVIPLDALDPAKHPHHQMR